VRLPGTLRAFGASAAPAGGLARLVSSPAELLDRASHASSHHLPSSKITHNANAFPRNWVDMAMRG